MYRAPDLHAIVYRDASDETPLVFYGNREVLLYEPIQPSVVYMKNFCERLIFKGDGNRPTISIEMYRSTPGLKDVSQLKLDAKSMCGSEAIEKHVVKDGENQYRLFLNRKSGAVHIYFFDLSKPQPFVGFKVFGNREYHPRFSVTKVVVDAPLSDEEFRLPDRRRLAEQLEIQDSTGGNVFSMVGDVTMLFRSCQVRLGATHPGLRPKRSFASLRRLDWDAIVENDRKYSAVLRELLPIDGPLKRPELPHDTELPVANVVGQPPR